MSHKRWLPLLCATSLLSACTLAPNFIRPEFSAAQQWDDILGYEMPVGEKTADRVGWKEFFTSPQVQSVIEIALLNNRDLKTAALNVDEARATYRISRADLIPSIDADGSGTLTGVTERRSETGREYTSKLYDANVASTSYEVDLFGKIRSQNNAAINTYLATDEAKNVVRNALISETANAYLQLLADQKLLSLTEKTLEAQQSTYDILSESLSKGVSTEQDLARAATAVETARANLHQYKRFVAQDTNALFLLMGLPQDKYTMPETTLDEVTFADNLDAGVPSEVLLLRPDIKQAEYELLSRNADIGAARAAFFPSITLTGSYGFASQALDNLFTGGASGAWSFLPQIRLPIFQGGRNKANLDIANIRKEKAVLNYEHAIQTAFSEVSDELAARATLDEQLKAQHRLVEASQKVYDISQARYQSGIDSFLSVLDSQRELYTAQQNEIQIQLQKLSNNVNLYKALGGGVIDTPAE